MGPKLEQDPTLPHPGDVTLYRTFVSAPLEFELPVFQSGRYPISDTHPQTFGVVGGRCKAWNIPFS